MDLQMPCIDGYTATETLRRCGFTKPILAVTALVLAGERERSLAAGCNEHISKPVDSDRLIESICRFTLARGNAQSMPSPALTTH
jgi:CheY-like chemotaxis protein